MRSDASRLVGRLRDMAAFASGGTRRALTEAADLISVAYLSAEQRCVSCGGRVDPSVDHDPEGDRVLCEDCCPTCAEGGK